MSYSIERELEWNQITLRSESGVAYKILMTETAEDSNIWFLDLILMSDSNKPNAKEIYQTVGKVFEVLTEKDGLLESKNIKEIVSIIQADDKDEMEKKTKVFTRWIRSPWTFEIHRNPVIDILGRANKIYLNKNIIHMKKTEVVEKNIVVNNNFKFCFNCGTENKGFKFCPNCGTNLKQA